ncbi:hypothetical protein B5S28_g4158 [[Candida] boidinii]|nr:hypothetical protein B5S28_g4158 [[Candida] boidinii]OWB80605.1 hypothetical protein B5S32_g4893 [[Candida] boidinii]
MNSIEAKVVYKSLNSCLVNLPNKLVDFLYQGNILTQNVVVELSFKTTPTSGSSRSGSNTNRKNSSSKIYAGWTGHTSAVNLPSSNSISNDENIIEIDPQFASANGLTENKKLKITLILNLTPIVSVELEPLTSSDWELTELYAQLIENQFLNQLRCIYLNQLVITFPNRNNNIKFKVKKIKSLNDDNLNLGLLINDSELHIAPKVYKKNSNTENGTSRDSIDSNTQKSSKSLDSTNGNGYKKRRRSISSRRSSSTDLSPSVLLRGISLPHPLYTKILNPLKNSSSSSTLVPSIDTQYPAFEIYVNLDSPFVNQQFKISCSYVYVSVISGPGTPKRINYSESQSMDQQQKLNGETNDGTQSSIQTNQLSQTGQPDLSNGVTGATSDTNSVSESNKIVAKLVHNPLFPPAFVGLSELLSIALGTENRVGDLICLEVTDSPMSKQPTSFILHRYITTTAPSINDLSSAGNISSNSNLNIKKDVDPIKTLKEKNKLKAEISTEILNHFLKIQLFNSPLTNNVKLPKFTEKFLPNGGFLEFKKLSNSSSTTSTPKWSILSNLTDLKFEYGEDVLRPESSIPSKLLLNSENSDFSNTLKSKSSSDLLLSDSEIVGQDKLMHKLQRSLRRGCSNGGFLLYGASGSGKTVILNKLAKSLEQSDGYYLKFINCETILNSINDNLNNFKNLLDDIIKEICWHASSVLVLDNLDFLIPPPAEHGDSTISNQFSELLSNKLIPVLKNRKISLIASAKSKESLNNSIFVTHLINDDFNLKAPEKDVRKLIIESYLKILEVKYNNGSNSELIDNISNETEGYLPSDLKVLIDRAHHDFISNTIERKIDDLNLSDNEENDFFETPHISINEEIKWENFENALNGFVPSSLRGVKLQKSKVSWNDIGGLRDAKKILLETLEWPTKYAPIFKNCPLRLRSGILLYGYPGCGKTFLASAISAQCGLNFISIKGPEILNKYIGASEQSVRELFERASAAKPCILFFDEFDSIAPKRGHDSTGVTDRVVNQMLTQMDGAEGLDGVYVLAATSRPDLIDSALLRPGRLDKSVICDMPDLQDREDILKVVTRTMNLDQSVDLSIIAENSEGFSGADLQAVAYNAYLKAIHEKFESEELSLKSKDGGISSSDDNDNKSSVKFFEVLNDKDKLNKNNFNKPGELLKISKKLELILSNSKISNEEKVKSIEDLEKETKTLKSSSNVKDDKNKVIITQKDLEFSLSETKPSISNTEFVKLQKIYSQFVDGRDGNMPDGQPSNDIGGRTTLM